MGEAISNALLITALGMGIVFAVLILLWGLMALMVRLLSDREEGGETGEAVETAPVEPAPAAASGQKRRAAAAAVAVALALQSSHQPGYGNGSHIPQPTASLSAWQLAMRANQLKSKQQRGPAR